MVANVLCGGKGVPVAGLAGPLADGTPAAVNNQFSCLFQFLRIFKLTFLLLS